MAGKITGRSQKGNQTPELTEDEARAYIEKLLWPNGEPTCRHCGSVNAYKMQGRTCRPGLCRCRDCEKQFTVTVGTIFEDSHLPLSIWVKAIHQMASSKKGMSALQLQRNLGIGSYRTAWFMAHRIRLAMRCEPVAGLLKDEVQVDETYVGANRHGKPRGGKKPSKRGRGTSKTPVLALVESKPGGKSYARPIERVDGKTLRAAMLERIEPEAIIVTDELRAYPPAVVGFAAHETVCHSKEEYVNADGYHTNTCESWFALFKRGVIGTFHHISKKHMGKYCDEFSFRWGERLVTDSERREQTIKQVEGKRLMYRMPVGA